MKKSLFWISFFISCVCLIVSCKKDSSYDDWFDDCFKTTKTYLFYDTLAGDSLTFEYLRSVEMTSNCCSDCGEGDRVVFKIDKGLMSFNFDTKDLLDTGATWQSLSGFCGCYFNNGIKEGSIKGEKINDEKWRVEIHLEREFGEPLHFKKDFILKN